MLLEWSEPGLGTTMMILRRMRSSKRWIESKVILRLEHLTYLKQGAAEVDDMHKHSLYHGDARKVGIT